MVTVAKPKLTKQQKLAQQRTVRNARILAMFSAKTKKGEPKYKASEIAQKVKLSTSQVYRVVSKS